jgi:hypothetical protein
MVVVNRIARLGLTAATAALTTFSSWGFASGWAQADTYVEFPANLHDSTQDIGFDHDCNQRRYCRIQRQRENAVGDPAVRQQDAQAIEGLLGLLGVQ